MPLQLSYWRTVAGLTPAIFRRELKSRFTGSVAGALWALLQPLMLLGVYALVFGVVFRASLPLPQLHSVPYVAYVALALWPWLAFSEAILRGLVAVQNQASLVKKVAFPSASLIVGSVLSSFALHFTGSVIVLLVLAAAGVPIQGSALPGYWIAFALLVLPAMGLALGLGAIQVFVRDVEQITGHLLTLAFYATPVLYTVGMLPQWLQDLVSMNPMGHIIEVMRSLVLGLPMPMNAIQNVAVSTMVFLLTLLGGAWIFARLSPHFEDTL